METPNRQKNWRYSIRARLLLAFGCVLAAVFLCYVYIYQRAVSLATQLTYEKMQSQADYYTQALYDELASIRDQQTELFRDRLLISMIEPDEGLGEFERRERLLSIWDKVGTMKRTSPLIEKNTIYLPRSSYRITAAGVRRINAEDEAQIAEYLNYRDGTIHILNDGEQIFLVETGELRERPGHVPRHISVITFSKARIIADIAKLSTAEGSGAFLYQGDQDALLEHSRGPAVGREILAQMDADAPAGARTQWVTVGREKYFVFAGGQGLMGLLVQYCPERAVMGQIEQFRYTVLGLFAYMILGAIAFSWYASGLLHRPMDELVRAFQRIEKGNWTEQIVHNRKDEFSYLYDAFNEMEMHMNGMIEQVCIQTNLAQRAQMKQLQAQIAPHFLFNSFFSLSRKIKRGEYEAAEALAGHLGEYFRYLTRNESDYVTLEQEVQHAKSYAAIQGIRFKNRITILFEELPEPFRKLTVPRLILQPLLENAFEHGLDNKESDGRLQVRFTQTDSEFRIWIEDNGDIRPDKVQELADGLAEERSGEITSFYNIHKRLRYLYGGRAGLRVCPGVPQGLTVQVFICKEAGNVPEFADR